ncbi:MAG: GNAT family N-acetyltransferase [Xanthomonadales bacterium]|nr:GNAT family N-acetyltransferase [Xanthomonadales bacterium]
MTSTLTFETLNDEHLSGAMRMSADVSWPHRLEDWAFVAGISNGVVAMEGDRVVATALATPFAPVGMVNLIIVDSAMRGLGLGRDIMFRAMETIAPDAWRLVATQDGLPLYEKLGFQVTGEIQQHQGPVSAIASTGGAEWATADDLAAMLALDTTTTGMDRHTLYAALADEARFAVLRDDTGITGFAAVRDFGRGEVAGPVIARTLDDAQSLLSVIMAERTGQFLRVDTSAGAGLGPWLAEQGLPHVSGGLLMQKGELPESPSRSHTIFALASQALG